MYVCMYVCRMALYFQWRVCYLSQFLKTFARGRNNKTKYSVRKFTLKTYNIFQKLELLLIVESTVSLLKIMVLWHLISCNLVDSY
jgi:hypothetical protein